MKISLIEKHFLNLFRRLNKMEISAILMSPPCQPFTRQGLQKDVGDARTEPLLNVIKMIPDVEGLEYVLVENVKGANHLYVSFQTYQQVAGKITVLTR